MRTRLLPALAAVAVVGSVPAGCGNPAESSSGREVLADAVAALEAAGSVRVAGTVDPATGGRFDIHVQGDDAVGTVWLADKHDAPFVAVDGQGYVLPHPDVFVDLGASEEEAAPLRGRYLTMPDDDWRGQWPGSLDDVVEHLLPTADEVAAEVEEAGVDGRPVLVVTTEAGRRLVVAARAPHRPLRLVVPADEELEGRSAPDHVVIFSDHGERRAVVPPRDPIPPEALGG